MFVCSVVREKLELVYAIAQLFSRWYMSSDGIAQDGVVQGRKGRPKERCDGIVVGLDKARHVNLVEREGDSLLGGRESVASHHGKRKLVKIKGGAWNRYAMSSGPR